MLTSVNSCAHIISQKSAEMVNKIVAHIVTNAREFVCRHFFQSCFLEGGTVVLYSVVTVLLFPSRFGFGSIFPPKPRFRFFRFRLSWFHKQWS